jgi:ubiquinone/menaquinone biosynthesis C-methylase UbiE
VQYANSESEYLDLGPLQTRIDTHRRYSERPDDVERAVLDETALRPDDALLDIGSGTGSLLARLRREGHRGRLVGLDTSPAAIAALEAIDGVEAVRADAVALPFADGAFAVVTARHMLYHVSDPAQAVREAWRVLAPGGRFVAVVNFPDALPETGDLLRTVTARHGVPTARASGRSLHSGGLPALIEPVFGELRTVEHHNALVYPSADGFARYCVAMLSFYGVGADFPARAAVVADVVAEAQRRFDAADGPLREPKGFSVSVGRRPPQRR